MAWVEVSADLQTRSAVAAVMASASLLVVAKDVRVAAVAEDVPATDDVAC